MSEKVEYIMTLKDYGFSSTIDGANEKVKGLEASLGRIGALAAGAFAVDKVIGFGKSMIQLAMDNEQAEVSFKVLLGSAEKAKTILGDLRKMGAETPFEYKDLQAMALNLKNANVPTEQLIEKLRKLGDISQGNVPKLDSLIRAYGKMNQTKKVSLEAINIMAESASFNPLLILAKEMSEKNKKAVDENMKALYDGVSKGAVSMEMIEHAIDKVTSKGGDFYDMLKQQSQTSAGQLSNVMDQIGSNMTDLGTALLPIFNDVLTHISNMITFVRESVISVVEFTTKYKTEIKSIGVFIAALTVGFSAYLFVANLIPITLAIVTGALNVVTAAQWLWNAAMNANPIGLMITAAAALTAGIYYLWQKSETFRASLYGIWEVAKVLVNTFITLGKALIMPTPENITTAFNALKNLKDDVPNAYKKGYKQGLDSFAESNKKEKGSSANVEDKKTMPAAAKSSLPAASALPSGKASSVKPTTINITIDSVIKEQTIVTQNLGMDTKKIAAEVAKVVTGVVVDTQRLAGL